MDDIKVEVVQIKDQYQCCVEYVEYGINKFFNVMFSGLVGIGKIKFVSYLVRELQFFILFYFVVNLEMGFVFGGLNMFSCIMVMVKWWQNCIVFLDEVQDFFMKCGGCCKFDDDIVNMLFLVFDGVCSKNDVEIIWIVVSNFNSEIMQMDEVMLCCFQMKVDFCMFNQEEWLVIIGYYFGWCVEKVLFDLDFCYFVVVIEGCSLVDLEIIVNQVGIIVVQVG